MHSESRGFTLLEVLVAFVIAAFALAALFSGGLGGLRAAGVSGRYAEATSRAQSHLAAATTDGLIASDRQGDEGNGFHWRVRIMPQETTAPSPGAGRNEALMTLFAVNVAVSWTEDGHTRAVQLDTLQAGAAAPPPP